MNINGNFVVLNVILHIDAIDEHNYRSKSLYINIIDIKSILLFSDTLKANISNSCYQSNSFSYCRSNFAIIYFLLAKWDYENYYIDPALNIKVNSVLENKQEFHIISLCNNVHNSITSHLNCFDSLSDSFITKSTIKMNRPLRRPYKRRSVAIDSNINDNVFYDEKTKKFTENCKLRRLKLSKTNCDIVETSISDPFSRTVEEYPIEAEISQNPVIQYLDPPKVKFKSTIAQRHSQRKKRGSFKKDDYLYLDSIDNMLKEKNRYSNNNSRVSTPVPFDINDEIGHNSPKLSAQFSFQNSLDVKDCVPSSNHSPISVSFTSIDDSPHLKIKLDISKSVLEDKDEHDVQALYKSHDDGKYQCLICTNKMFRKKQLLFDHIKHYHSKMEDQIKDQYNYQTPEKLDEEFTCKVRKAVVYNTNKRYYSSYLKNNRKFIVRKRKYKKTKIKSLLTRKSRSIYCPQKYKSKYQNLDMSSSATGIGKSVATATTRCQTNSIIYCHRCKKSFNGGCLVQCAVCLCWSHSLCYGFTDGRDVDSFWECDSCALVKVTDGTKKNSRWYRDRSRFHSIARNDLPWSSSSSLPQCNIRPICELHSFLSLCQRVLTAITIQMDRLLFGGGHDDLDILKNLCVYDEMSSVATQRVPPNSSILDCEIQRLDILDKAAFDALVNDLYRRDSRKNSLLDLIDEGEDIDDEEEDTGVGDCRLLTKNIIDSVASLDSLLPPLSDSTSSLCLFRTQEMDDIDSLLVDRCCRRSNATGAEMALGERKQAGYRSDSEEPCAAPCPSDAAVESHSAARQSQDGLAEDAPDWPPSLPGNPVSADPQLSASDSRCLHWLMARYQGVETIVAGVERCVEAASSGCDEAAVADGVGEQCSRVATYLHSLLYILRRG